MRCRYPLTAWLAASALLSMFSLAGCGGTNSEAPKSEAKSAQRWSYQDWPTGPYKVVEGWPKPLTRHAPLSRRMDLGIVRRSLRRESQIGSGSPCAASCRCRKAPRRGRLTWRSCLRAACPLATPTVSRRPASRSPKRGWERRFEHSILIVDGQGNLVGEWPHLDKMFGQLPCGRGPHQIKISPYDPEKHVWIIDDQLHMIYRFTYDGMLVHSKGQLGVRGREPEHVRPPDGHRLAAGRHLLHHRRLRWHARRQVRRQGQLHQGLGPGAGGPEEPGTERVQHRSQHRHQRRPPPVRRRSRAPADAGLRRKRQVPGHVAAALTALAGEPGHAHGRITSSTRKGSSGSATPPRTGSSSSI